MADEPAPYPPAEPGTMIRRIPFPVASPDRAEQDPAPSGRLHGGSCDWRKTLGLPPAGAAAPDDLVTDWRPVL